MTIILIFFLYKVSAILQANGQFYMVEYGINDCSNGFTKTITVDFRDTFDNIPQIIIYPELIDMHETNTKYIITLEPITTTYFDIKIQCPNNRVYAILYKWFAIDDKRIEVINQFDINTFSNVQLDHKNPNADKGFISLISFGYVNQINFDIKIDQITKDQVFININDLSIAGSLTSIGYQLILGTNDAINMIQTLVLNQNFISAEISVQSDSLFMLPISGINYQTIENIRLKTEYPQQNPIQYSTIEWDYHFTIITQSQIWLKYSSLLEYQALQCVFFTMQVSNKGCGSQNYFKITFKELQQTFELEETQTLFVDKEIKLFTFKIEIFCTDNHQIQAQYHFNEIKQVQYSCTALNNLLTYQIKYSKATIAHENLIFTITSTSCSIQQILQNQVENIVTLLEMKFIT